jgi:hypothetical protein
VLDVHAAALPMAGEMTGYRDLPMAPHDEQVLTSAKAADAFERFAAAEGALLAMLEERLEQDPRMLAAMDGAG